MEKNALISALEKYLNSTEFLPDWRIYHVKRAIARIFDLSLEVYPKDHRPAHFHVVSISRGLNARFSIETLEYLSDKWSTDISNKDIRRVQEFLREYPNIHEALKSELVRMS